jgi:NAD(P)-dependent dehydrogenase (short-subunit alcohol dehydrogenase family)
MTSRWTAGEIPDQHGRTAIVTGANSGLGRIVARELAGHGARVIVASRDSAKGAEAASAITASFPSATVEAERLDLADLGAIRTFADRIRARHDRVDLLINNAGRRLISVVAHPGYSATNLQLSGPLCTSAS